MERSADMRSLDIILQSIDHRLELLNTEVSRALETMHDKMDRLKSSTVSSADCERCQQSTKAALKDLKESAVSKIYFIGAGGALGFVVLVLGIWTNWDKLVR